MPEIPTEIENEIAYAFVVIWSGNDGGPPCVFLTVDPILADNKYAEWRKGIQGVNSFEGDLISLYELNTETNRQRLVKVSDSDKSPII
jgi:hypothetical protein